MIVEHWLNGTTPATARQWALAGDIAELLPLFAYAHLPPPLATASQPFGELASDLVAASPEPSLQLVHALTHLLKAKDAGVRARLVKPKAAP